MRALGWRGPILLLEGCFEARDLELCSRLNLWHAVHCEAQIDWLAAHKTHAAAPRVPEDEQRHEPAGLRARGLPRRLGAPERAAAGGRDLADDALRRCRRRARHRRTAGRVRGRHARPARRALAEQQRRHAAPRDAATWRPTGCAPASWSTAARPTYPQHDIAHWQPAAGDDAALAADRRAATAARRPRRLRQQLRGRGADAHRRRRLRLCRRLPARLRHRHAGAGGRRAHAHGRPRVDGHDHRRPGAGAGGRPGQRGHAVGRGPDGHACCRSTRWRARPVRSATN